MFKLHSRQVHGDITFFNTPLVLYVQWILEVYVGIRLLYFTFLPPRGGVQGAKGVVMIYLYLFENCSNTMDERSCACGLPLSGEAAGLRTSYSKLSTRSTKHVPTIRETEPTTDPMNLISNRVHCLLMVSLFRPLTFHPVANRWQHHLLVVCVGDVLFPAPSKRMDQLNILVASCCPIP